jgi:hypothetical protein
MNWNRYVDALVNSVLWCKVEFIVILDMFVLAFRICC